MAWELRLLGLVALAAVLGAVVGWEREQADKPAGLRTHMLVAAAAALIVAIGRMALDQEGETSGGDPSRALHAVITGIGFLGAGTILRSSSRERVSGLTTATTLFVVAAIGAGTGFGLVVLSAGTTLIVLVTLRVLGVIEHRLRDRAERQADVEGGDHPGT